MANIKDIANLAGVSKSTVSRVVSNNGFVKPETREKIEALMQELNYKPNMFAKGMRTNKSQSIGIVFPDLTNPFFAEWYKVIDTISRKNGYLNYICISDPKGESEESRIDDLLARSIDGIILFSYTKNEKLWKKLENISSVTPVICCDSMFEGYNLNAIYADGKEGTKKAAEFLIRLGKKRIAYIKGSSDFEVVKKRYEGYCQALKINNIPIEKELIVEGEFTKDCGKLAAEKLMSLPNKPDTIMASTDFMAIGVLEYLQENNFNIPEEIAVFGFDNLQLSETANPPLSTIAMPLKDMAEASITRLMSLIENPKQIVEQRVFDCELKIRKST